MTDKEKAYKGLKIHVDSNTSCLDCPYNGVEGDCLETLHKDILDSFYGEFHNE